MINCLYFIVSQRMAVLVAGAWGECKSKQMSTLHRVENTPQGGVANILGSQRFLQAYCWEAVKMLSLTETPLC